MFVRNLLLSMGGDTLLHFFEKASHVEGSVERVSKHKDYAFVHFSHRQAAQMALDETNGMLIVSVWIVTTIGSDYKALSLKNILIYS